MYRLLLLCLGVRLGEPPPVARIEVEGNDRTRASTFTSLLPRPLPTALTPGDVEEVERRIRNLELFDDVAVAITGPALRVRVREKHSLIPSLELWTGRTAADTFVSVGVTEYNLPGMASGLNLWASWEQRGPNGGVAFWQHRYAPRRWAWAPKPPIRRPTSSSTTARARGSGGRPASAAHRASLPVRLFPALLARHEVRARDD